jgi:hypothetical protein
MPTPNTQYFLRIRHRHAVLTSLTTLPRELIQLNGTVSGNATHPGDFTGPSTRIQDNQGNFGTTEVFIGADGIGENRVIHPQRQIPRQEYALGPELFQMLRLRNGFYAFESALQYLL